MRKITLVTGVIVVAVVLIVTQPWVESQVLNPDPGFSPAISALRQAESAGATPAQVAGFVKLLNKALAWNREASKLNETQSKAKRLNIEQILDTVTSQARELAITSAQTSLTKKILTYASGVVVAILGTLICALVIPAYQEYRIRRTFRMRVRRT